MNNNFYSFNFNDELINFIFSNLNYDTIFDFFNMSKISNIYFDNFEMKRRDDEHFNDENIVEIDLNALKKNKNKW